MDIRIKQLQTALNNRQAEEDAKKRGQALELQCKYSLFLLMFTIYLSRNLQKVLDEKIAQMEKQQEEEVTVWENVLQRYIQGIGECKKINEQLKQMIKDTDASIAMLTKNKEHALKAAGVSKK